MAKEGCGVPISLLLMGAMAAGGVMWYLDAKFAPTPAKGKEKELPGQSQKATQSLEEAEAASIPEGVKEREKQTENTEEAEYIDVWDEVRGEYVTVPVVMPNFNISQDTGSGGDGHGVPPEGYSDNQNPENSNSYNEPSRDPNNIGSLSANTQERIQILKETEGEIPSLESFTEAVRSENPNQVVGVYVEGKMALPIVQQPSNDTNFVSREGDVATQFSPPSRFETVALLAHNYLAGKYFPNLIAGDLVTVIYGDGRKEVYRLNNRKDYQALSPDSPSSDFIDLDDIDGGILSAGDVYNLVYTHGGLVLQTCIEQGGNSSWGRMFLMGELVQERSYRNQQNIRVNLDLYRQNRQWLPAKSQLREYRRKINSRPQFRM